MTCSNLPLTTSAITCLFRASSDVCGFVGNPSFPIAVILKGEHNNVDYFLEKLYNFLLVPNAPRVEVVPSYLNDSQALQKLFIATTMNQTASDIS